MSSVAPSPVPADRLSPDERYFNRELSWLAFNERVLAEASNPAYPLLERLRFLSISGSNLDEFMMIRVAGLAGQVRSGVGNVSIDGKTPSQQLAALLVDGGQLLGGGEAVGADDGDPRLHLAAQARHANHVEFIQIVGRDRQEAQPLEERMGLVAGLLQYPLVEGKPGSFPIYEPVERPQVVFRLFRQRHVIHGVNSLHRPRRRSNSAILSHSY